MYSKGYEPFLAYVLDSRKEKKKLEDVKIIQEFMEVFLYELPDLPPKRQVEFSIILVSSASLIAKSYRFALLEMKELMS